MPSSLSVFVQHHRSRTELLPTLLEGLAPLLVEVVPDDGPLPANPWRGYQLCLRRFLDSGSGFGLIVQDDVRVCTNLPPAVSKIAEANPDTPVVLFLAKLPLRVSTLALRAAKKKESYVRTGLRINEFMPVVSVLWPQHKAAEFLTWTEENPKKLGHQAPRSDDSVAGRWAAITRQTITFTVPSLIQHPDEVKSLIGRKAQWGKDKGRIALMFCEGDPLEINWDCP